jgi:hypothetical protein
MKRVKCAASVTEVAIELPGGEEWIFAMDMGAMAMMLENGREISTLFREYEAKPVSTLAEILYYGLKDRQPEITLEDVRRRSIPTSALLSAITDAIADALPDGDAGANPMVPPTARRRKKKGRAG